MAADGKVLRALALEDAVRPESSQAVDELHRLGRRVVMITGDARLVAEAVAGRLGIDEVFAEVLPEDKDGAVADLQRRGLQVAMVGDGVNDAPGSGPGRRGRGHRRRHRRAIESAGIAHRPVPRNTIIQHLPRQLNAPSDGLDLKDPGVSS